MILVHISIFFPYMDTKLVHDDINLRFFSRPSPKAGRELQTVLDIRDDGGREGPVAKNDRSPDRESTQRLCTCSSDIQVLCLLSL